MDITMCSIWHFSIDYSNVILRGPDGGTVLLWVAHIYMGYIREQPIQGCLR